MKLTQKTIKSINTFELLALGYISMYLATELADFVPSMVLLVPLVIFILTYLLSSDEEPKPHICKYCGAETTQPDNECYANNPPPQETL